MIGEASGQARANGQDLLGFNEFLIQFCQKVVELQKNPNDSLVKEAETQKEIIKFLLEKYDAFFFVGQLNLQHILEEELIQNYLTHKTYYDNLDFAVSLLFFHNIFLHKTILKSPREVLYPELESSFVLAAISKKYFSNTSSMIRIKDLGFDPDSNKHLIFPLLERLNLKEIFNTLCCTLRSKHEMAEEDTDPCILQKKSNDILRDFPKLKDEFLVSRLKHYLKTALDATPECLKQKLVIERTLQLIGESINVEDADPSSIRHLLRKCLPVETLEVLKQTRNTLSHMKSKQFPLKFDTELDDSLFASIQLEIRAIKNSFEKVFNIQRIRLTEFLMNRGLESVQNYQEDMGCDNQTLIKSMKSLREVCKQKCSDLELDLDKKETAENGVIIPGIIEFFRKIRGFASKVQEDKIYEEIPPKVKLRVDVIQKLEQDLDLGIDADVNDFDSLFLKKSILTKMKNDYKKYLDEKDTCRRQSIRLSLLNKIRNSSNPFKTLELILGRKKVSELQLAHLFDEIPFSDEAKRILNTIIGICNCRSVDNLSNLLNRINHLYDISIKEYFEIQYLWERVISLKAKQYLVYKIVQRYFREPSFQASLEMLLLDCYCILDRSEDFRCFCLKDSYLFNGIDVRNVLAHGDPLIDTIGNILDPKDLPSELVKKTLQLFEDRECIKGICGLWERVKKSSNRIPDKEWYKMGEHIIKCKRWENYSKLLPDTPKEIKNVVITFLKNITQPKEKKRKKCNSQSSAN